MSSSPTGTSSQKIHCQLIPPGDGPRGVTRRRRPDRRVPRSLRSASRRQAERGRCGPHPGTRGLGGFLHTDVAPLLASNDRAVFYVGDYDHAGAEIEANTARVLEAATGPRPWARVALTAAQAQGLPVVTKPDRRYRPARAMPSVEVRRWARRTCWAGAGGPGRAAAGAVGRRGAAAAGAARGVAPGAGGGPVARPGRDGWAVVAGPAPAAAHVRATAGRPRGFALNWRGRRTG